MICLQIWAHINSIGKMLKYIYAGAQKNMGIPGVTICIGDEAHLHDVKNPAYLNLKKLSENDSVLNTPSTFSVYILHLVCQWMVELWRFRFL